MPLARNVWLYACWLAIMAAVWLSPAMLWAQRKRKEVEPPKEPSYALEYGAVIFVILFGLAVVFRPTKRIDPTDELKLPTDIKRA